MPQQKQKQQIHAVGHSKLQERSVANNPPRHSFSNRIRRVLRTNNEEEKDNIIDRGINHATGEGHYKIPGSFEELGKRINERRAPYCFSSIPLNDLNFTDKKEKVVAGEGKDPTRKFVKLEHQPIPSFKATKDRQNPKKQTIQIGKTTHSWVDTKNNLTTITTAYPATPSRASTPINGIDTEKAFKRGIPLKEEIFNAIKDKYKK